MKKYEKQFGAGIIALASEKRKELDYISTGCIALDYALGGERAVAGIPRGFTTVLWGEPGSGKTTIANQVIANAIADGLKVVYIDAEGKYDHQYAELMGLDRTSYYFVHTANDKGELVDGENVVTLVENLIRDQFDLVVLDSIAAISPKREVDGLYGEANMGVHPRLVGQLMRRTTPVVRQLGTAFVILNQARANMERANKYMPEHRMPGAYTLSHEAGVIVAFNRGGKVKIGDAQVGTKVRARVEKNVGTHFKEAHFEIITGAGTDKVGEVLSYAIDLGIVKQAGAWLTVGEQRVNGREAALALLGDYAIYQSLRQQVIEKLNGGTGEHVCVDGEVNNITEDGA